MLLLIFYVLLALAVSFLCSILEATLLTINPVSIEAAKQRGVKWGGRMQALKNDVDRPLSAILTLNTIAHTMGAAGAGAQYVQLYGNTFEAVFAGVLTLAILVVTEIIPKTLGARYALQLAGPVSWLLPWMIRLLSPLVWLCRKITSLVTFGQAAPATAHREELLAVARIGEKAGELNRTESAALRNLLELGQTHVRDIMTPRSVMFTLPEATPLADFPSLVASQPFSRIPVHGEGADDVTGFVLRTDALLALLQDPSLDATLASVRRPIVVVLDHLELDRAFRRLVTERQHLMLVRDEHGSLVGLVTLEDIIETIFGFEILDEVDTIADLQGYARKLWQRRAARMGLILSKDGEVQLPDDTR